MTDTRLDAKLSLTSIVFFGVAYMAPGIVMSIFGVIAVSSVGTAPTAYLIATGAMFLTALSYAKMARIFPGSGSVYTYARKALDSRVGFLVGWAILLDYLFLPMVAWFWQSVYLNAQFPAIPVWVWLVLNAGVTTVINVLGIVLTDRVNRALTVLAVGAVLVFVIYCVVYLGHASHTSFVTPLWNQATSVAAVTAAAAIAAYSFLGFDAVTTLSEETRNPTKNIPRGIIITVLVGGVIFVAVSYIMQLVHPGAAFADPTTASYEMSVMLGGRTFADAVNIAGIVGGFASGLAIQASTSRLLYVMGRDGVLPRRFFGRLHPTLKTPVFNLILIGAVAMLAVGLSADVATSFINFGAFTAFTVINLCVIAYFLRNRKHGGRFSILGFVVLPTAGAIVDIFLITQLSATAIWLGVAWLALGVLYLTFLTKGFRTAPPEMSLDHDPAKSSLGDSVPVLTTD